MSRPLKERTAEEINYLSEFKCLADKCPDTCCSNWEINIKGRNKEFYKENAPEIIGDIEDDGNGGAKMKQVGGPENVLGGDCIQLQNGMCKLQNKFGESHLPDICFFFPRSYKKIHDKIHITANMACPESLRVALFSRMENKFSSWNTVPISREKDEYGVFEYEDISCLSYKQIMDIYNSFSRLANDVEYSANQSVARLLLVSFHLDQNPLERWPSIKDAIYTMTDQLNLLHVKDLYLKNLNLKDELVSVLRVMFVLINRDRRRFNEVLEIVRKTLGDHKTDPDILWDNYQKIKENWNSGQGPDLRPVLKNLLKVQVSCYMFPMDSYFPKRYQLMLNIAMEYLACKLALMCVYSYLGRDLTQEDIIDTVQPVAKRFYVLGDQEVYDFGKDCGWDQKKRFITTVLSL